MADEQTLDLATRLKIDGTEYKINAETANKVNNKLTIAKSFDTDTDSNEIITYDGSESKTISIVSADDGGAFRGPITVPSFVKDGDNKFNDDNNPDDDHVINYGDLIKVVMNGLLNGSLLYEWNDTDSSEEVIKLELKPTLDAGTLKNISIVTGPDKYKEEFAAQNKEKNNLKAFFYIGTDTNIIYFGTSESDELIELSVAKLAKTSKFKVNLESDNSADYNGTQDTVEPGVSGVLPVSHGGTGVRNLNNLVVPKAEKAEQLEKDIHLGVRLDSTKTVAINGSESGLQELGVQGTLPVVLGGTGTSNLDYVTVGRSKKANEATEADCAKKITAMYVHGTNDEYEYGNRDISVTISHLTPEEFAKNDEKTASQLGDDGDIWIKY